MHNCINFMVYREGAKHAGAPQESSYVPIFLIGFAVGACLLKRGYRKDIH